MVQLLQHRLLVMKMKPSFKLLQLVQLSFLNCSINLSAILIVIQFKAYIGFQQLRYAICVLFVAMDERLSSYALIARAAIDVTIPLLIRLFSERFARLYQVPSFSIFQEDINILPQFWVFFYYMISIILWHDFCKWIMSHYCLFPLMQHVIKKLNQLFPIQTGSMFD